MASASATGNAIRMQRSECRMLEASATNRKNFASFKPPAIVIYDTATAYLHELENDFKTSRLKYHAQSSEPSASPRCSGQEVFVFVGAEAEQAVLHQQATSMKFCANT